MRPILDPGQMNRMFTAYTEHALLGEIGVTDTRLVDYLAGLLVRFIHRDQIFGLSGQRDRQTLALGELLKEAERSETVGPARRELFRHIGDFALFWTGVFPEAVGRGPRFRAESIEEYTERGKHSYLVASTYRQTPEHENQAPVLRLLSDEFEICATGLRRARDLWEQDQEPPAPGLVDGEPPPVSY